MAQTQKVTMLDEKKNEENLKNDFSKNAVTITDSNNRKIVLKKPNVLAQYHIVETVGASAENTVYMAMVMPLLYVESIDGMGVSITKKSELEALILRLDDDGIASVMKAVQENFMPKNMEDGKEQLKK